MRITQAHGSGGRDSAALMENIFGKYFSNAILDKMEDAAVIDAPGKRVVFSTDTFVVTPPEFRGGNIGKLSICGTANDILMMGAIPRFFTCGFVLEEGLDSDLLERVVSSMAETAAAAGIKIVAGDTKVAGNGGGLFINTSGIGFFPDDMTGTEVGEALNGAKTGGRAPETEILNSGISASNCRPGDKIILSGTLGDHHACILSARMNIKNEITSDCAVLSDVTSALLASGASVHAMRDVTRGGLGTILNELSDSSGCQITINENDLPVSEPVRAFCGILGLDPMYMGNEGKMVAVIAPQAAEKALAAVKGTKNGRDAAIIGEITGRPDNRDGDVGDAGNTGGAGAGGGVILKTSLGGTRFVDVLHGEGLPRIC